MTRVATVQAEPVWADSEGTLDKTLTFMKQAADLEASLVVFPDLWIPGHPVFLSTHATSQQSLFRARYRAHSLSIGGPVLQTVSRAARDLSLVVATGFSEIAGGMLHASTQIIDADGRVVLHRRRDRLSSVERSLFTPGTDGANRAETIAGQFSLAHAAAQLVGAGHSTCDDAWVALLPCLGLHHPDCQDTVRSASPADILSALRLRAIDTARPVLVSSQIIGSAGAAVFAADGGRSPVVAGGGGFARVFGSDGSQLGHTLDSWREGIVWADISSARLSRKRW